MLGVQDGYSAGGCVVELGEGLRQVRLKSVVLEKAPFGVRGGVISGAKESHFGSSVDCGAWEGLMVVVEAGLQIVAPSAGMQVVEGEMIFDRSASWYMYG